MTYDREPVLDTKIIQDILEFVYEEVDFPEGCGFGREVGRTGVANLVIKDDGARGREIADGEKVVVREAGTTVQNDSRRFIRAFEVTKGAVPGVAGLTVDNERDFTLGG